MFEILTVCTGNICRSPLAQLLLDAQLAPLGGRITSAGTRGAAGATMTPEAVQLASDAGIPLESATAHRARFLTEGMLDGPDLLLAMTREHRRTLAEYAPGRLRHSFTVREFARLAAAADDDDIRAAADEAGPDPRARVRAMAAEVAAYRGVAEPLADPADDDVVDPYRRSWQTYQLSSQQLTPAVAEVVRAVRLAVGPA